MKKSPFSLTGLIFVTVVNILIISVYYFYIINTEIDSTLERLILLFVFSNLKST